MTKKEKLIWRLGSRPTVAEVRELVSDKIISPEEAREILFSSETEEDRDKKSLEAEIKFLRQLVEKLSESRTQIVEKIRDVYIPYKKYDWYQPYYTWTTVGNSATGVANLAANTQSLLSAGAGTQLAQVQTSNFSDIKTF